MSKIEDALKKAAARQKERVETAGEPGSPGPMTAPGRNRTQFQPAGPGTARRQGDPAQLLRTPALPVSDSKLVSLHKEKSPVAEQYNKLRSSLIALTQGPELLNTLLITSCASEEGKSLTAFNLAISLAREQDHTVLLVDTDLRRPSLHRFLGLEPEVGLVHCLRDQLPLEQALIKTGLGKLVILPAGETLSEPLDLLSSQRMRDLIAELKQRYPERYVIFDTPPAMPFADAGVLADMIDNTLFVVREGRAGKEDVRRTLEAFKDHNLLGVVFNDARSIGGKQGYYDYYY